MVVFSFDEESIYVGGLTDSQVAVSALMIRLKPLLNNRQLINEICIIPTEDMPNLPIFLSDGKIDGPLIDFDPMPTPEESFVVPGVVPEKLTSLVVFARDLDRLLGIEPANLTSNGQIQAMPATVGRLTDAMKNGETPTAAATLGFSRCSRATEIEKRLHPSPPRHPNQHISNSRPFVFPRNTFLLQANQDTWLASVVEKLKAAPLLGNKIIIRAMKPDAGSATFNDYICQRRADEVKNMLSGQGIAASILTTDVAASSNTVDNGEVRVIVQIPPPPRPKPTPADPEKESTEPPTDTAAAVILHHPLRTTEASL